MSQPTSPPKWDFGRFFKTLSYFGAIPVLSNFDWFQTWIGNPPVKDGMQLDSPRVLVIDPDSEMGQRITQHLVGQGFKVRSSASSHPPGVEIARIAWDQPLQAQPDWWRDVGAVVCVEPSPAIIERLAELAKMPSQRDETLLVDFTQPQSDLQNTWGALDDVVMGGVSSSNLRLIPGAALFAGIVSTANSGGFASVRSRNISPPLDLSTYEGLALRLQGDGQRYKFLVRCEDRWDGVAYSASFDTVADEWITVRLPFQDLIPVFRARTVDNGEPINRARISSLQLMLSKFEYNGALNPSFSPGEFQLKIAAIAAYRVASPLIVVWVGSEQSQLVAAQQAFDAAGLPSAWVSPLHQSTHLSGDGAMIAQRCAEAIAPG